MNFTEIKGGSRRLNSLQVAFNALTRASMSNVGGGFAEPTLARAAISLESIDAQVESRLDSAVVGLNAALEEICNTEKAFGKTGNKQAAIAAGLYAGDTKGFLRHSSPVNAGDGSVVIAGEGGMSRMQPALEAYDERDNAHVSAYSVAYNFQAARQDELGELFFPTVVVTPDQVGYSVVIDLVEVQKDIKRGTTGAVDDLGRRNIIQGLRDSSVLANEQTRIYPVARAGNVANLIANATLAHRTVSVGGESFPTSPILFGKKVSLLGISQTDGQLAAGASNVSDQVDTAVTLDNIYMSVTSGGGSPVTEIFKFPVERNPGATFVASAQGNYRQMVVNFSTKSLMINKDTLTAAGVVQTVAPAVISGSWKVNFSVDIAGQLNLDTSETSLNASDVTVQSIEAADGTIYAPTDSAVSAVAALFATIKFVGYELKAFRSNLNRRQRGQLLNLNRWSQTYAIPLLSPVTVLRPQGGSDNTDTSDLGALITATRIRTSNAAVAELLAMDAVLKAYVSGTEAIGNVPEILSVARFLVQPFYKRVTFDAATATNSIRSQDRAKDIQAALLSQIRDLVYQANRDSGYKAAADSVNGGSSEHPLVLVGTDQVLSRYLFVEGDLRTLGIDFEMKVASSMNKDMAGKIFISFGQKGAENGVANPLHFGNMGWRPELTLVLPLQRDGSYSKELTVQPAFRHVTNLPILIRIDVTNLSDTAVKKTVDYTHSV
jgi:hypothetical protein